MALEGFLKRFERNQTALHAARTEFGSEPLKNVE
jgi:hypothetical protein